MTVQKPKRSRKKAFPVMIGIRLNDIENARLRAICDRDGRKISDLVREIIRDWLAVRD